VYFDDATLDLFGINPNSVEVGSISPTVGCDFF